MSDQVNLKSGDVSVRINRALDNGGTIELNADKNNVDWEFTENSWVVKVRTLNTYDLDSHAHIMPVRNTDKTLRTKPHCSAAAVKLVC